jgi:hypothetical protein
MTSGGREYMARFISGVIRSTVQNRPQGSKQASAQNQMGLPQNQKGPLLLAGNGKGPVPPPLERDAFWLNRHRALSFYLSMIFFGKPVSTFPDHALGDDRRE